VNGATNILSGIFLGGFAPKRSTLCTLTEAQDARKALAKITVTARREGAEGEPEIFDTLPFILEEGRDDVH